VINLAAIFTAASNSPTVKRAGVMVVTLAVVLYGVRLAFGSDARVTTAECSACAVSLADKNARLELTQEALRSCVSTVDTLTGAKP
jgi:hypothetical protein